MAETALVVAYESKGFRKVAEDAKKVVAGSELMTGAYRKLGEIAVDALKDLGRELVEFGKESIAAASQVEEMQSKFNTVFRDLGGPVTDELAKFAEEANRSVFALQGFAATFQDTFVPLGFARETAADMSVQLVKLAEDLGSFNDIDTETVVRDLQSALVGNTETLRKYGVVAQETQIKAKALEMGLWDGKGAIDAQAKSQTILQLALEGTTDAQGDAVKTADSYANVSKGLDAAMMDLKVTIGQSLIPAMTDLKKASTETVSAFSAWLAADQAIEKAERDGLIAKGSYTKQTWKLAFTSYNAADATAWLADQTDHLISTTDHWVTSGGLSADVIAELTDTSNEAAEGIDVLNSHMQAVRATARALNPILESNDSTMLDGIRTEEEMAETSERLAELIDERREATEAATKADEEAAEILEEELKEAAEAAAQAIIDLNERTTDYFQSAIQMEGETLDASAALYEMTASMNLGAEATALMGVATGQFTADQAEAALKTALLQLEIERLVESYAAGTLSADQAAEAARLLGEGAATTAGQALELAGSVDGAAEALWAAKDAALEADAAIQNIKDKDVMIRVQVQNAVADLSAGYDPFDGVNPFGPDAGPNFTTGGGSTSSTNNSTNNTVNQTWNIQTERLDIPSEQRAATAFATGGI